MGRQPCCDKVGLKRGPWTIEEDQKLMDFILNNGVQCWRHVPKLAGLPRCGKSCRLRWMNYLRPDLKRGALSEAEEDQIIELHSRLGNRWSKIAAHFPGRTDNEIKNQWNTRIKKKLKLLGLDPVTHKPLDQQRDEKEKEIAPTSEGLKETDDLSSGKSTNLLPTKESLSQEVDARSSLTLQSDHFCSSSRINESVLREDQSQQYWIENVDSLLSWDGFGSLDLEDLFILDNHQ